jgi:hypothetical protein
VDNQQPLRVLVTGTTGMVGEGVLLTCLDDPGVEKVLSVSRRPCGITHAKLTELIVADFMQLEGVSVQLTGWDACFFCAGVSSVGMKEAEYTRITYDTTLHCAGELVRLNPQMTFIYVSGASTDSTEKGRIMWARVKGRTENALQRVGFARAFAFRPGFMKAVPGQRHLLSYYKWFAWLYPLLRLSPNLASTLHDVAIAMLRCARDGYPKPILEVRDINELAKAR